MHLGECSRPVEVVDDHPRHHRVEARVSKRQLLCLTDVELDLRRLAACHVDHLCRCVDSHTVDIEVAGELPENRAGTTADVENATPA
jgi:hypothetical protein